MTDVSRHRGGQGRWVRRHLADAFAAVLLGGLVLWIFGRLDGVAVLSGEMAMAAVLALSVGIALLRPRGEGASLSALASQGQLVAGVAAMAAVAMVGIFIGDMQPRIAGPTLAMTSIGLAGLSATVAAAWWRIGAVMPVVVLVLAVFVLLIGPTLPARYATTPLSPDRLVAYLAFDTNGLLSRLIYIAANTIVPFVIFGAFFARLGAGAAITAPLQHLLRNCAGGGSKAAVLSSAAFGLVSGSAVANVSTSAPITVPMMLRDRMDRSQAAAIEAVASTTGQLLPPVMGASAFLMAEWLGMPYAQIALAAAVPAGLAVCFLICIVDFDARRRMGATRAAPPADEPPAWRAWSLVPVLLPLAFLGYALFFSGTAPGRAALLASGLVIAVHLACPGPESLATRAWAVLSALRASVPAITGVLLLAAMAALVMSLLQVSGASFMLTLRMIDLAQGSFALLALLTALLALMLGLGMPTIGVYIVAASLCAPVLAAAGTDPLAAHMFILFMGMLSMVTPPVAMATFTAAMIAEAPLWESCARALRLAIGLMLVAAAILIQPALLAPLEDPHFVAAVLPFAMTLALTAAVLAGHAGTAIGSGGRILLGAAAVANMTVAAAARIDPAWAVALAVGAAGLWFHTQAGQRRIGIMLGRTGSS